MQVWWTLSSNGTSTSRVYAHDVAKQTTTELPGTGTTAAVLALAADGSGHVWMGHQGGLVQVWCAVCQRQICDWSDMSPNDVR